MNTENKDIRWKQRFENFEKAYKRMHTALQAHLKDLDNELYHMALIQTFEFTYELGWKTVRDYLKYEGVKNVTLPREVIKHGFNHNIIEDGQCWINMMEDRNLMSHTYDEEKANKAVYNIREYYVKAIGQVYNYFKGKHT